MANFKVLFSESIKRYLSIYETNRGDLNELEQSYFKRFELVCDILSNGVKTDRSDFSKDEFPVKIKFLEDLRDMVNETAKEFLDILKPYDYTLSEDLLNDVRIYESVLDILSTGNIPDLSDVREAEFPIYEEQLA